MNSIILRTITHFLTGLMLVISVFVLLRGHNEPGGGFIGGLIAASGFALHLIAFGPQSLGRLIRINLKSIIAAGLVCALLSGAIAYFKQLPFLTGIWLQGKIGTPLLFDLAVYLVVLGSLLTIILALEEHI